MGKAGFVRVAGVLVAVSPMAAMAQSAGGSVTFTSVLDPTTLVTAAAAMGGAGLLAAFGVGGGFRLAKKTFSWMMNKI